MSKRLYVGNFPYDTSEDDLKQLFMKAGTVAFVSIILDRDTQRSRGFGFVEMSSDEEAQRAISILNKKNVGRRSLTVKEATPKESPPSFSGKENDNEADELKKVADHSTVVADSKLQARSKEVPDTPTTVLAANKENGQQRAALLLQAYTNYNKKLYKTSLDNYQESIRTDVTEPVILNNYAAALVQVGMRTLDEALQKVSQQDQSKLKEAEEYLKMAINQLNEILSPSEGALDPEIYGNLIVARL